MAVVNNVVNFGARAHGYVRDTLVNLLTQIGGGKDKSTYARYVYTPMQRDQLEAAYRTDWIARKIVDIPAADATREWRSWQAEQAQIELLEEAEEAFQLKIKVKRALIQARLYGGSVLIMGMDDGTNSQDPLDIEKVQKGQLKFIHAISRHGIQAGPLIQDIESPWFLEPEYYIRRTNLGARELRLHPSRVVRFVGNEVPDEATSVVADSWGDPVLQAVDDAVRGAGRVISGISSLIDEMKVDVISIPGLTLTVATQEGRDAVSSRLTYANQAKSTVNALVLDKDETWQRLELNLAGMPDLMKEYMIIAAGAADIPATRMLAQSPKGMNATGQSDTRNYYDMIASAQDTVYGPKLERLDNVLIHSIFGADMPEIFYEWNPLWQMDDNEKADIAYKKGQTFQIDVNAGVFPDLVLREARLNQLIEDGTYPGIEAAMEEADQLGLLAAQEEPPPDPNTVDPNADPNAPPPANQNDPNAPKPKKGGRNIHVTVKTGDAAGMIRRFRRRARRVGADKPNTAPAT